MCLGNWCLWIVSGWWCHAKCEPRAGCAGIDCNRESRNHRQAPSHEETQWRYLPSTTLTNANKEGGKGGVSCHTKARFGAHSNCKTSQSEHPSSEVWCRPICKIVEVNEPGVPLRPASMV